MVGVCVLGLGDLLLSILRLPVEESIDRRVLVPLVLRQRLPDLVGLERQTQLLYLIDQLLLLFCI